MQQGLEKLRFTEGMPKKLFSCRGSLGVCVATIRFFFVVARVAGSLVQCVALPGDPHMFGLLSLVECRTSPCAKGHQKDGG